MITVKQRNYRLPTRPTVVVCVDGCELGHIAQAWVTRKAYKRP